MNPLVFTAIRTLAWAIAWVFGAAVAAGVLVRLAIDTANGSFTPFWWAVVCIGVAAGLSAYSRVTRR